LKLGIEQINSKRAYSMFYGRRSLCIICRSLKSYKRMGLRNFYEQHKSFLNCQLIEKLKRGVP
jgi:hypothetical protein